MTENEFDMCCGDILSGHPLPEYYREDFVDMVNLVMSNYQKTHPHDKLFSEQT